MRASKLSVLTAAVARLGGTNLAIAASALQWGGALGGALQD
jgi:hypothetical protein